MSKINTIEIKGFINKQSWEDSVLLSNEKQEDDRCSGYEDGVFELGEKIKETFDKIKKPVNLTYSDWTKGEYTEYKDVFLRYYISKDKITWEEITEEHIKIMCGTLETQQNYDGYSEYTITDSWIDVFVGGHNINNVLKQNVGKYFLLKLDYKTND